jgi:hypothetical protein
MFALLLWGYLTAYLGIGRLILLWLRRYLYHRLLLSVLIHLLLVLAGAGVPYFLQAWLYGILELDDYTALQTSNWLWTLAEAADGHLSWTSEAPVAVTLVALFVLVVNLALAAREVEQVRQETPARVCLDELTQHRKRVPAVKRPTSPFEDA